MDAKGVARDQVTESQPSQSLQGSSQASNKEPLTQRSAPSTQESGYEPRSERSKWTNPTGNLILDSELLKSSLSGLMPCPFSVGFIVHDRSAILRVAISQKACVPDVSSL